MPRRRTRTPRPSPFDDFFDQIIDTVIDRVDETVTPMLEQMSERVAQTVEQHVNQTIRQQQQTGPDADRRSRTGQRSARGANHPPPPPNAPRASKPHSRTLYEVLEVSRHASQETIRAAWVSLNKRYHPDTGVVDEEKIKAINAAYDVLKDVNKRAVYDRTLP